MSVIPVCWSRIVPLINVVINAFTAPIAGASSVRGTHTVLLMKNVVVVNAFEAPKAPVIPVCGTPNVPITKQHDAIENVLKKNAVSVKLVILTFTVPAVGHAVVGHAQVAQIASVNPVSATKIVKYQNTVVKAPVKAYIASVLLVIRTFSVLLMQNVVVINASKIPIASATPVCGTPDVPMEHVVMTNVFKEVVASVKVAN